MGGALRKFPDAVWNDKLAFKTNIMEHINHDQRAGLRQRALTNHASFIIVVLSSKISDGASLTKGGMQMA
jgi:hypothetical protein